MYVLTGIVSGGPKKRIFKTKWYFEMIPYVSATFILTMVFLGFFNGSESSLVHDIHFLSHVLKVRTSLSGL